MALITFVSGFSTQTCVLRPLLNEVRVIAKGSSQVVSKAHTMLNHQAVLKLRKNCCRERFAAVVA